MLPFLQIRRSRLQYPGGWSKPPDASRVQATESHGLEQGPLGNLLN